MPSEYGIIHGDILLRTHGGQLLPCNCCTMGDCPCVLGWGHVTQRMSVAILGFFYGYVATVIMNIVATIFSTQVHTICTKPLL